MAHEWLMFMVNVGKYIPYVDSLEHELNFNCSERFCVFFSQVPVVHLPAVLFRLVIEIGESKNQQISMVRCSF